jgi:hypothetical protein
LWWLMMRWDGSMKYPSQMANGVAMVFASDNWLVVSTVVLIRHPKNSGSTHMPGWIINTSSRRHQCLLLVTRSILHGYFNPLVFWYQ